MRENSRKRTIRITVLDWHDVTGARPVQSARSVYRLKVKQSLMSRIMDI